MPGDNQKNGDMETKLSAMHSDGEGADGSEESCDENFVFDEDEVRHAFAMMICTDDVPPQIIEEPCFLKFMRTANPFVQLGSIETTKAKCLEIYKKEKEKTRKMLADFDGQISLSVDVLKSPRHVEYMCLTAHFICDSWKLKKWILRLCPLCDEDNLAKELKASLSFWHIEGKISTITLKNYRDHGMTLKTLEDYVQENKKLQLNGQLFRVHCCADMLSLIVQDALNEIADMLDRVRGFLSSRQHSPYWHLTCHILKEVTELYSAGEFFKDVYHGIVELPPATEWKKLEGIAKLLYNVSKVAKCLFESKHLTSNIFLYNLQELRASLIRESTSADGFTKMVAEKMLKEFNEYWKDMFLVLAITTVLDPRYKMKYFEFYSSKYAASDGDSQVSIVLESIHTLFNDYVTKSVGKEKSLSSSSSDSEEEFSDDEDGKSPCRKYRRIEEECDNSSSGINWLQDYNQFIELNSQRPKSDLEFYLEEPVIPWIQDFDALKWWKTSDKKYPTLSRMARDFLAVPMSVATSFEAYRTELREVDGRLWSCGRDVMEALMCTRSWDLFSR